MIMNFIVGNDVKRWCLLEEEIFLEQVFVA